MLTLVAATANSGKLDEVRAILGNQVDLRPRPSDLADVIEDAPDLEGNARLKAEAVLGHTGLAAIADDTGLEVEALGGEPGVWSARFAGPDADDAQNVALLLERLDGRTDRRARFHTVALVASPEGELMTHGICAGVISDDVRGQEGFGYDPVFIPDDGDGRTFAEMSREAKNAISHRGRAFRSLAAELERPAAWVRRGG